MIFVNCTIDELSKMTETTPLVCFGAGKLLRDFLIRYKEYEIHEKIQYVVDNMPQKIGKNYGIESSVIPIISVSQMLELRNKFILMITCADTAGVYEQLQACGEMDNVYFCAAAYIISETCEKEEARRWYPDTFRITKEQRIEKKIHYCWFGKKPIPEKNLKWMDSWKRHCPDYEIIRWDESNYDVKKNNYMHDAYKAQKWGFVSDYARLDIIYQYGGIYLDTDVEVIKPLDDLLYQKGFMGIDNSRRISLGLGFGAEPKNEMIYDLRNIYQTINFIKDNGEMNLVAAPTLQVDFFGQQGFVNNGEYQMMNGITVYPEKVLSPKCNHTGRVNITRYTYTIHHFDGSWCSAERMQMVKLKQAMFQDLQKSQSIL